jgi:endoglucanase
MKRYLFNKQNKSIPFSWLIWIVAVFSCYNFTTNLYGQGFLHAEGKNIVNGIGENIILRGIGTGNWMIQEGYMMESASVAGTQHEFEQKLASTIGAERTKNFYDAWLSNGIRKIDIDSMASWGFNSIRLAMHYKWFTPPIEEEPVQGEITWRNKGFQMVDSLLSWCAANHMYLILDLHAAPGGQGKNASISDYDPSKPSLWESDLNKEKTVALWQKLARRYQDSKWIGGYDLLNEVNWSFSEKNNIPLLNLYMQITNAIRKVDTNHLIFIEGNWFANDFSGLTPPWDGNMAYSFHKYWSINDSHALDWVTSIRNTYNCPIWLGESGENSNTWFTNMVILAERNNIGWSTWPVKKSNINNVLKVKTNEDYKNLIKMWGGEGTMTADQAYQAVMTFANQQKFENCSIAYDVIDALIRQPHTCDTKAFKPHSLQDKIFAADYDLGRNGFAYWDTDTVNINEGEFNTWNFGWAYRNDGVDIQACNDMDTTMGYSVGWIKKGEWLLYTIDNRDSLAAYTLNLRSSSEKTEGLLHLEVNGKRISKTIQLSPSGSFDTWTSQTVDNILLPKGTLKLRICFDSDGFNMNYFQFTHPKPASDVPFELLAAHTDQISNNIYLDLNKTISNPAEDLQPNDFQLIVNNSLAPINQLSVSGNNPQQLILTAGKDLYYNDNIRISYTGKSLQSNTQSLNPFTAEPVSNRLYPHAELPGKVEAENFIRNHGFILEACRDENGGENLGYADVGDYVDYLLKVPKNGVYRTKFRVAVKNETAEILVMKNEDGQMVPFQSIIFQNTGGWQLWKTQTADLSLPAGKMVFRIYSRNGKFNLNWFSFEDVTGIDNNKEKGTVKVFPNPASDTLQLIFPSVQQKEIFLYDIKGKLLWSTSSTDKKTSIKLKRFPIGTYIVKIMGKNINQSIKFQIVR